MIVIVEDKIMMDLAPAAAIVVLEALEGAVLVENKYEDRRYHYVIDPTPCRKVDFKVLHHTEFPGRAQDQDKVILELKSKLTDAGMEVWRAKQKIEELEKQIATANAAANEPVSGVDRL